MKGSLPVALTSCAVGANWGYRLYGYQAAVLPYGILLSGFDSLVCAATGCYGRALVLDRRFGTSKGS